MFMVAWPRVIYLWIMRYVLFFLAWPTVALSQSFALLADDEALSRDDVIALTERHLVEFYEGGQSRYSVGGSYSYTYQGGGTAYGAFEVQADGTICILFRNGRDRCDRFVRSHGRIVMITQTGAPIIFDQSTSSTTN